MMKKTTLQIFALVAALSFVGGVAAAARGASDKATEKKILEEIAGYKSWERVTDVPMPVETPSPSG